MGAWFLQQEEDNIAKAARKQHDRRKPTEMMYKNRSIRSSTRNAEDLLTLEEMMATAHPSHVLGKIKGLDDPLKRHDPDITGQLNNVRLGLYDGVGELDEKTRISNRVYTKIKKSLDNMEYTKTT